MPTAKTMRRYLFNKCMNKSCLSSLSLLLYTFFLIISIIFFIFMLICKDPPSCTLSLPQIWIHLSFITSSVLIWAIVDFFFYFQEHFLVLLLPLFCNCLHLCLIKALAAKHLLRLQTRIVHRYFGLNYLGPSTFVNRGLDQYTWRQKSDMVLQVLAPTGVSLTLASLPTCLMQE